MTIARSVAAITALLLGGSPAAAKSVQITLEPDVALRTMTFVDGVRMEDTDTRPCCIGAQTSGAARTVRITVENREGATPDSYEIAIGLMGLTPIHLTVPLVRTVPCTTKTATSLGSTQYTPDAALYVALQARYLIRVACGSQMDKVFQDIFNARLKDLTAELGHRVKISL